MDYELGNLIAAAASFGSKAKTKKGCLRALRMERLVRKAVHSVVTDEAYLPRAHRKRLVTAMVLQAKPRHIRSWYVYNKEIRNRTPRGFFDGHGNTGGIGRVGEPANWYPVAYYWYQDGKLQMAAKERSWVLPAPQVPQHHAKGKGSKAILRAMRLIGAKFGWTAARVEGGLAYVHPVFGHYHPAAADNGEIDYRNTKAADDAFIVREAMAKKRQAEIANLTRIWVMEEDSLRAGNCEPVTRKVRVLVQRKIGRVHAVRADVLLEIRDDAYARRAIRVAAERLGRHM